MDTIFLQNPTPNLEELDTKSKTQIKKVLDTKSKKNRIPNSKNRIPNCKGASSKLRREQAPVRGDKPKLFFINWKELDTKFKKRRRNKNKREPDAKLRKNQTSNEKRTRLK